MSASLRAKSATSLLMASLMFVAMFGILPLNTHAQQEAQSAVEIQAFTTAGIPISGYDALLLQTTNVIASCFSTCSFNITNNVNYQIYIDSYGNECFVNWNTVDPSDYFSIYVGGNVSTTLIERAYFAPCAPSNSSQLTITSQTTSGATISGYYTVLNQSSTVVATGYTPTTFNVNNGETYIVQVDNYQSCNFAYWADTGNTSYYRTVDVSNNTQYTAVYNCTTSTISVSTVNSLGSAITGYYIALFQGGTQVAYCFSACTFPVGNGQTYQVVADSYGSETFNHWQNDGSTGAETVNIPSTNTTISLTAVYSP